MRGKALGMMAVMAAMLGQGLAEAPPESYSPGRSYAKNSKRRSHLESPTLEKRRKAKRRMANESRKINQAHVRQQ